MVPEESKLKKSSAVRIGSRAGIGPALKMVARYVDQTPPVMQLYDALWSPLYTKPLFTHPCYTLNTGRTIYSVPVILSSNSLFYSQIPM